MSWAYITTVLIMTGINLLAVIGLSVLTGFTGLFSFGHAGFMAIGAYTSAILTVWLGVPYYLALLIAGLAAGLISLVIGRLTLKLKGDYFIIATLGFGESIRLLFNWFDPIGGSRGFRIPSEIHYTSLSDVIIINLIALILIANLINSRHGRNFKAIREEEMASQVIGINIFRYKMLSFFISAVLVGIAGGMLAHLTHFLIPRNFDMTKSTFLTIMVILGGLGSLSGSVIGTVVLTFIPEFLRNFNEWRYVIFGFLVVLVMVLRPKGLMGGYEISDLLRWVKRRLVRRRGEKNESA
ncbi:MAG TPA: branched-chain amino acid ABC transporter permease [Tissierellia bacterium]|nr:branched-chain amino acid ABC transporter permease [Tissierellia bacterium]